MRVGQSRTLLIAFMLSLGSHIQAQNLYSGSLQFHLFQDTTSSVSAVSFTIGEPIEIPSSMQRFVHLTEHCLLHAPQSSFSGRSLTEQLRMKGARCTSSISSNQITIAAASATLPASEMITDILQALRLDSLTDAELRKQQSALFKEQEAATADPGALLEAETRAILCTISHDDCIGSAPVVSSTSDDWMIEYRIFVKDFRNHAPFRIGVSGKFDEPEIKGASEMGLYDYLQKDNPDAPVFEAIAPPERSHYFSLLNENASVPEMTVTWVAKYSGEGKPEATGRIAARMAEIISRDLLSESPFESMRMELKPFTGFSLFQIHAIPKLTDIQSATDSLPQFLDRLCDSRRWTEDVWMRAVNMERLNEKHFARNPIRLLTAQSRIQSVENILPYFTDSVTLADVMAWTENHIDSKPFVAGIVIGSQLNDFMGVEELFASADQRAENLLGVKPPPRDCIPDIISTLMNPVIHFQADVGEIISSRIYFLPNSSLPDDVSANRIYKICDWLKQNPDTKLFVNGYADSKGDGVKNYKLSIERAASIRRFMMDNCGIPQSRLLLRPFGEAFPEFEETSAENIRKNRRVTFEIAPKDATETPY